MDCVTAEFRAARSGKHPYDADGLAAAVLVSEQWNGSAWAHRHESQRPQPASGRRQHR